VALRHPRGPAERGRDVADDDIFTSEMPVTLFIDPFGRPLSPVSVCGVRRRERRRVRRRI
jgi:hypothetical protein